MSEDIKTEVPLAHSSVVGGSTASRRLNCTASLKLEQRAPKSKGSSYAREGTALHEMIAQVLDHDKEPMTMLPFTHNQPAKGNEEPWSLTVDHDLWDRLGTPALDMFDDFLTWLEADQDGKSATFMIEEQGEFPDIEGAFGTSDVIFRCGDIGGIWDWKFGRGPVSADDNEQLMYYFVTMLHKYPEFFKGISRVVLCISQPQVNDQEPDTWETTLGDIDNFRLDLVDAIAEANTDDTVVVKGKWCNFADCKALCPLHVGAASKLGAAMGALEVHKKVVEEATEEQPAVETEGFISDMGEFLSTAMDLGEMAESWAKHIAVLAQERLEAGLDVAGFKVVAKASSGRIWKPEIDEGSIVRRLQSRGLKAADYYNKKIITPPQAEKKLKKLGKELPEDAVMKRPSSGFTLTRTDDPRHAAKSTTEKAHALGSALMQTTEQGN